MRRLFKFVCTVAVLGAVCYLAWNGFLRDQLLMHRYPVKYGETVSLCARKYDIPEEIIFAVIHTESGFNVGAESHAGAKGLMQIIDSTNKWIAEVRGEDVMADRLYEPAVNIDRGAWYLAYLYKQFGTWEVAAAAYNAGYGRVSGWLSDKAYSADGKNLYNIPISETREYVERVMEAASIYRHLYFK